MEISIGTSLDQSIPGRLLVPMFLSPPLAVLGSVGNQ